MKKTKLSVQRIDLDEIAVMPDEELQTIVEKLELERTNAIKQNFSSKPWEEEISYIRREQQLRHSRRRAHARYLSALSIEQQAEIDYERNLPLFDDRSNREFVKYSNWSN